MREDFVQVRPRRTRDKSKLFLVACGESSLARGQGLC
jgi:hypothetical protein